MLTEEMKILREIRGIGQKRSKVVAEYLRSTNRTLEDFFGLGASRIKSELGFPINVAEAITRYGELFLAKITSTPKKATNDKGRAGTFHHETISLSIEDKDYPHCITNVLGNKSPRLLYMWGNRDLLCRPAVGFCGSRNVTEAGLKVTEDVVEQSVHAGWTIVSGHAKGVDFTAHQTAIAHGGSTIIVAAEGILAFNLRQELKRIARPEQVLVISEFESNARWAVWRAMQRNHTILALSQAMVLIESRLEGGTYQAGKAALRLGVPLFVAHYASDIEANAGNQYFLSRGAFRLEKNRFTGRANIETLSAILDSAQPQSALTETSQQLKLL